MSAIWHHTFYNELRVCPEEHPVLLSESPCNPKENRRKTAEIMFETFNLPSMYLGVDAVFALYASGRTTGVVLHSGDDVSHSVPIYEGYALKDHVHTTYIGGRHVTDYLINLMNTEAETHPIIRDVKEKLCLVATDYNNYIKTSAVSTTTYELPDGRWLELDVNRFKCTECLFQPSFIGKDKYEGIHEILYKSVQNHDFKTRKELFRNVVLEGGNTMFDGISERLSNELKGQMARGDNVLVDGYVRKHKINGKYVKDIVQRYVAEFPYKIKVIAPPERKYSVWIGASVVASTTNACDMFVAMDEYKENGANVINTK
eukprot:1103586_1